MDNSNSLNLGYVQETLMMPLWGRAFETMKEKPLLVDNKAVEIVKNISYDFSTISKNISKISRVAWIARSIYFDSKIKSFIDKYPDSTIVNLGCGLDTTFERMDNGKIIWFDLDLPDVISLRKKYISESDRRHFISESIFENNWRKNIKGVNHLFIMIAGVLYYFEESEVKKLFIDFCSCFPDAEIVFDYCSLKGIEIANKKVIEKGGMNDSAKLKWGIDDIYELEKWSNNIKIIEWIPMFKEHKKKYPVFRRIGMNISDMLKIMSLAHARFL